MKIQELSGYAGKLPESENNMTDEKAIKLLQHKFGVKVQIFENGKWHLGNFVVDADIARKLAEKFTVK